VHHRRLYIAAAVFFLLIFPLDVWTPHGLAVPIFYVLPVMWFGIWSSPNAMVPAAVMGVVSTVLAGLGFAVYMVEETTACDVINRVLAIAVVWISVLVILLRKGYEQEHPAQ
jgi:hypothetical protein